MKHHPLCYNDYIEDNECELCWVIDYVIKGITPQCSCGHDGLDYYGHLLGCKYGAFVMSQDNVEWEYPQNFDTKEDFDSLYEYIEDDPFNPPERLREP